MGATNATPGYALPLFADNDKPTWRGDVNGAMSKIDTELTAAQTRDTTIDGRVTAEVSTINTRINTEVSTLNDKIDTNVNTLASRAFFATVTQSQPTVRVVKDWEADSIPVTAIATMADKDRVWCQQDKDNNTVALGAIKAGDTGWVDVPLTDTVNFEPYQPGEQIQVRRVGSTVELRFQLRLKTAGFIDGLPDVIIATVPKQFRPASRPRYGIGSGEAKNTFSFSVSQTTGSVRLARYGPEVSVVGAWLRGNLAWTTRDLPESDFGRVFANYQEGVTKDYSIFLNKGTKPEWSSIAIHGGGIEVGTTEAAQALQAATGAGMYVLESRLASGNSAMHLTSTLFDDIRCEWVVKQSRRCISWHGAADKVAGVAETFVGGLDTALRDQVILELQAAGFAASLATDPEILGTNPENIANQTITGLGVQLELTTQQRKDFFPNGDWSRSVRESGQRTPAFSAYINAVRQALVTVT